MPKAPYKNICYIGRHIAVILLLVVSLIPISAEEPPSTDIFDILSAREYCDSRGLLRPEGIWEFPDDATKVMIRTRTDISRTYDIILLSSPDCRLLPGEIIGRIEETVDPDKYQLSLFCDRRKGILTDMRSCAAELNTDEGTLRISPRGIKLSIRTIRLLPSFWKLFGISLDNPKDRLPVGLIRIYPHPKNTSSRHPRYY